MLMKDLLVHEPNDFGWLGQCGQELPGSSAPDRHNFLEADSQQGTVVRKAAAARHQAVVGSYKDTRPRGTLVCQMHNGERKQKESMRLVRDKSNPKLHQALYVPECLHC